MSIIQSKSEYNSLIYKLISEESRDISSFLKAISIDPTRPEAWSLYLHQLKEEEKWQECYTFSNVALHTCDFSSYEITSEVIQGEWHIKLINAISTNKIGKRHEYGIKLQSIVDDYWEIIPENHRHSIKYLIVELGHGLDTPDFIRYDKSKLLNYNFPFVGLETIDENYSATFQDLFTLSILKGKKRGTYLEIGSHHPYWNNNTALLERFEWKGSSIEIEKYWVDTFNQHRINKTHQYDATQVNYREFLDTHYEDTIIDYLQLDCEPSDQTYKVLLSIPFDKYKFRVITYEHDHCMDTTRTYRNKSRMYLESLGYELVVNDIGSNGWFTYEDWWVHPELVDRDAIEKMKSIDFNRSLIVYDYFIKK